MDRVVNTFHRWWSKMKRIVACICCVVSPLLGVQAQELSFNRVTIPAREGELVGAFHSNLTAGDRRVVQVEFRKPDGAVSRFAFVGVKGTESEELFNPYRDAQAPYATDVKPLAYRDKVVVSIRNVGPGGVDSIWVTDGTSAGTREIAQVDPGADPFVIKDTLVLITEDAAVNFVDLRSGAVTRLAEAYPSETGWTSNLGELADGRGIFAAGSSVYVSDGTVVGTETLMTRSDPFMFSNPYFRLEDKSDPSPYRVFSLELRNDGLYSPVFVTDGTAAGTREIPPEAFQPGTDWYPGGIQLGNSLIYANSTVDKGRELWSLNLETLQASLLKDIHPGSSSGLGQFRPHVVNRQVFFVANDGVHGDELWVSDGTAAGTALTKDIAPDAWSGVSAFDYQFPNHPSVGRYFIFGAQPTAQEPKPDGPAYPQALWASDGTAEGTFQLAESIPYGQSGTNAINDDGVLVFASLETFGIDATAPTALPGDKDWYRGVFLRFFDPTLGPPTSAQLITLEGSNQPIGAASRVSRVGEYYYVEFSEPGALSSVMISAPRQLCPGSDFKPIPGQCGCGVEEIPADDSGGVAQSPDESDGSAICLTPIGPIYVPAALKGSISGKLTQSAGQATSVQLTIPASIRNALQVVTTAPGLDVAQAGIVSSRAAPKLKVQHGVSVVLIDKRQKAVKKYPLRKTSTGTLKVKLSRRLTTHQQLAFQYAVGASKGERQLIQTPYKKSGAVKLSKARR